MKNRGLWPGSAASPVPVHQGALDHERESVDAARLSNVAQLYRRLGWSAEEARARAVLLYAFIFGQSLIFLGPSLRKRASMTAACAEILIEVPAFDAEDST